MKGFCECGCGEKVKCPRSRFRPGHQPRLPSGLDLKPPNPSGLCQCGCGGTTAIATQSRFARGIFRGEHVRFLPGHGQVLAGYRGHSERRRKGPDYLVDEGGCWVWQHARIKGYGRVRDRSTGKDVMAHRFYFENANGAVPEGMELDHLCRNRSCVNPDHLEAVDRRTNARRGAKTKLTADQVRAILRSPESFSRLALRFGMSKSGIGSIKSGRTWSDIHREVLG